MLSVYLVNLLNKKLPTCLLDIVEGWNLFRDIALKINPIVGTTDTYKSFSKCKNSPAVGASYKKANIIRYRLSLDKRRMEYKRRFRSHLVSINQCLRLIFRGFVYLLTWLKSGKFVKKSPFEVFSEHFRYFK